MAADADATLPAAVKVEVKEEEKTSERKRKTAAKSRKIAKIAKVKKELQDQDDIKVKEEEGSRPDVDDQTGFTMELKLDSASALRNALRSLRVPGIHQCRLQTFPDHLAIRVENQNGSLKALLRLEPRACTVFKCTKSYTLILDFQKLFDAVCNPSQSEQGIIRVSIGDRKLPIIVQSGTNSTTFDVEVQDIPQVSNVESKPVKSENSTTTDKKPVKPKKPEVWGVIYFSAGFFNSILHSMEEMAAYKTANGTQLDIDNMNIDIKITPKMVILTAFGVVYRLTKQEGNYTTANIEKKGNHHVTFPLNELANYIRGTANASSVSLFVNSKWNPNLTCESNAMNIYFIGKLFPSSR